VTAPAAEEAVATLDPAGGPAVPGRVPDAVLGAAVELSGDGRVEIALDARLQPRSVMTASAWVCWGAGIRGAVPPAAPPAGEPPVLEVHLIRRRARRTVVEVAAGGERAAVTVDLDSPAARPGAGGQLDPGRWHHLAVLWDGPGGVLTLLLDGVPLVPHAITVGHLPFRQGARVVIGTDPVGFRHLLVGPVRVHRRLRPPAELAAERLADLAAHPVVDEQAPIAFRLADDVDEPTLTITDDDAPGRTLHVVLQNRSSFPVSLPRATGPLESRLELRFRPGCLAGEAHDWTEPGPPGWQVAARLRDDGSVSLFLGSVGPRTLAPGAASVVTLDHVRAAGDLGAHGTVVELRYPHPHHPWLRCERVAVGRVVGRRGRRRSPLRLAVRGTGLVVNDGVTGNELTLRLVNTSPLHAVPVLAPGPETPATALVLSFVATLDDPDVETGAATAADAWALGTVDQLLAAKVAVERAEWAIEVVTLDEAPEWVLTPTRNHQLRPGGTLDITVSALHTTAPDGRTTATLRAENVPGHWDSEHEVELVKAPHPGDVPAGALVLWESGRPIPDGWSDAGAPPFAPGPGGLILLRRGPAPVEPA
jgi:hypothetical protein